MKSSEVRIKELTKLLLIHDEAYYRLGKPSISDREYDRLKAELDTLIGSNDQLDLF